MCALGFKIFNYFLITIQSLDQHDAEWMYHRLSDMKKFLMVLVIRIWLNWSLSKILISFTKKYMRTNNIDCNKKFLTYDSKQHIFDLNLSFILLRLLYFQYYILHLVFLCFYVMRNSWSCFIAERKQKKVFALSIRKIN